MPKSTSIHRRQILLSAAGATLLGGVPGVVRAQGARLPGPPFRLGVASGDPLPDGVVLWTRLAPKPLEGGGIPDRPFDVGWRIAGDDGMRTVVQSGTATARPELGHSVHVEVSGLRPGRHYWYQFDSGGFESPVGRTRTTPALDASPARLRFAFASCQNYEDGFYTAYRHMAGEELDFVVHLGDYIYEKRGRDGKTRQHLGPECESLRQYRDRYAQYKMDADLQAAHAAFPFLVTWDDHEVAGDYANEIPKRRIHLKYFLRRRAAAYQAYYEHMPLRRRSIPDGPNLLLYRRFKFGDLMDLSLLDTRQYRTDQACDGKRVESCNEALLPSRTMLGAAQEKWLFDGLDRSRAIWNAIGQQVPMAERAIAASKGRTRYAMDKWDGYIPARARVLKFLAARKPANPVVLSGDVHANWVSDLKQDFTDAASPIVGSEFIGTSISSGGDGRAGRKRAASTLKMNPHLKFFNGQRGYVRCEVSRNVWRADYKIVPFVSKPGAPVETAASFIVENGQAGIKEA